MVGDGIARPQGTRRLVARELEAGLELLPTVELTDARLPIMRAAAAQGALVPRPLSPEQQAVNCREVRAPGLNGAPDVRLLVFRPAGEPVPGLPAYLHIHGGGYVMGGVATELHVLPGVYHGFGTAGGNAPQVRMSQELRMAALARAWA